MDKLKDAEAVRDQVMAKDSEEVGWRDAGRLAEALTASIEEARRAGTLYTGAVETIEQAREIAAGLGRALKNGDHERAGHLSERLNDVLGISLEPLVADAEAEEDEAEAEVEEARAE